MLKEDVPGIVYEAVGEIMEEMIIPRFDRLETWQQNVTNGATNVVTKDYLDEKLENFKDSLREYGATAGQQVRRLTTILHKNGTISTPQFKQVIG